MNVRGERTGGASVSWDQVTAFRLGRHHLAERAPTDDFEAVARDMGGAQAQLLSAAQIALGTRVRDLKVGEVESAIWEDRTLVRAWCMRRTLHLLPSKDLAIFVRGTARRAEKEVGWMRHHGVSDRVLEAFLEATLRVLDRPLTQSEIAERLSQTVGSTVRAARGGGWGSQRMVPWVTVGKVHCPVGYLLHLVGARGVVCSGPGRGSQATYVRGDAWLPRWRDVATNRAERELLRRFLRAFGPATPEDFRAWTSMRLSDARAIWSLEAANLASVDVEGWPAWVLRRDLAELERAQLERPTVRLLPNFDSFLLGHDNRGHLVDPRHHARVYRPQGWISPVILVDGRVAGVWSYTRTPKHLRIRLEPFRSTPRAVVIRMRAEGRELGRYLGCPATETTIA